MGGWDAETSAFCALSCQLVLRLVDLKISTCRGFAEVPCILLGKMACELP